MKIDKRSVKEMQCITRHKFQYLTQKIQTVNNCSVFEYHLVQYFSTYFGPKFFFVKP